MIIYLISNTINSKKYVGQTTQTLRARWSDHVYNSKHLTRVRAIHLAMRKYGVENFIIEQIDSAETQEELNEKEKYWIKYYDCVSPKGYNLTSGGEHCEVSEEVRRKQSERMKGKFVGEKNPFYGKTVSRDKNVHCRAVRCVETGEVRKSAVDWDEFLGVCCGTVSRVCRGVQKTAKNLHFEFADGEGVKVKHTEETKNKLRELNSGSNNPMFGKSIPEEVCRRFSEERKGKNTGENNPNYGRKLTEEEKKLISERLKGKFVGEKNPNYGKHHSKETKRKISEAVAGRFIGSKSPRAKKVMCIETEKTFGSLVEAARSIDKPVSTLYSTMSKNRSCGGYHWRYID